MVRVTALRKHYICYRVSASLTSRKRGSVKLELCMLAVVLRGMFLVSSPVPQTVLRKRLGASGCGTMPHRGIFCVAKTDRRRLRLGLPGTESVSG